LSREVATVHVLLVVQAYAAPVAIDLDRESRLRLDGLLTPPRSV
jgi:hypothetical protein